MDAYELDVFSSNDDAPSLLHDLVYRLLRETPECTETRGFDTREGLRFNGWDGATSATPGSAHVPQGEARWELSTKNDPRQKANAVYKARSADPQGVIPAETTLVIVTMHRWPGMEDWRTQKQKDGVWHKVVTIDAQALERWLEDTPQVWRWLTNKLRPAPRPPAPAQLPPVLVDFVGREADLRELHSFTSADQTGSHVVAIAGKPGVGKTSLAVRHARSLSEEFTDGVLYANLQGTARKPVDPSVIQSRFLEAMHAFHGKAPDDHDYLTSLYRTAFHGKRMLLVLDNAADEEQVRPLLPGSAGCTVLVTSRTSLLGLEGAHHLRLDTFSQDEAIALMVSIAGEARVRADVEATTSIVRLCGELPLAIRIAGTLASSSGGWGLAYLEFMLRNEHDRLDTLEAGDRAVRASFALSYRRLKPGHRQLFRRLSLIPGQVFDDELAEQVVVDLTQRKARKMLRRLATANLIEVAAAPGCYGFHDLIRLYSNERALLDDGSAVCDQIQKEVVRDLFRRTRQCDVTLESPHRRSRLKWLDLRFDNILGATYIATRKLKWHLDAVGTVQWLHEYLKMRNAWLTMDDLAVLGLDSVGELRAMKHPGIERAKLTDIETQMLVLRAEAASSLRHFKAAIGYCDQATELSATAVTQSVVADVENMRGNVLRAQNRFDEALHHYLRAADLCDRSDGTTGYRTVQYNIGNVLRALGRLREAIPPLTEEADFCHANGNRWSEAITRNTLGITYKGLGLCAEAKEQIALAIEYFDEFDDVKNKGNALFDLGNVHNELKEYDQALHNFTQDLEICRSLADDRGTALAQVAISRVLIQLRNPKIDEALWRVEAAMAMLSPERDPVDFGQALTQFGAVADRLDRFDEADEAFASAVKLFQQEHDWHAEAMAHFAIGRGHLARKNARQALIGLTAAAELLLPRDEFADRALVFASLAKACEAVGDKEQAQRWRSQTDQSLRAIAESRSANISRTTGR
ncbi:tetratricopeptide repeat protein [Lentzea alba]|uniref:ATP-binding protein n=1 Tax=Lentzea alba TaxID=2714351 RepID=UPI0039BFF530